MRFGALGTLDGGVMETTTSGNVPEESGCARDSTVTFGGAHFFTTSYANSSEEISSTLSKVPHRLREDVLTFVVTAVLRPSEFNGEGVFVVRDDCTVLDS